MVFQDEMVAVVIWDKWENLVSRVLMEAVVPQVMMELQVARDLKVNQLN
jgi:hypothetical protein